MGGINLFGAMGIGADAIAKVKARPLVSSKKEETKKLWQLKGRRRVRSFQVECTAKSLNKGDVFILDTGLEFSMNFLTVI
jgi:hypothetical protein